MATKIVDWLVDTSQRKHKKQVRIEVTRQTKGSLSGGCYQELQIKQNIEDNLNHMAPPTPMDISLCIEQRRGAKKKKNVARGDTFRCIVWWEQYVIHFCVAYAGQAKPYIKASPRCRVNIWQYSYQMRLHDRVQ